MPVCMQGVVIRYSLKISRLYSAIAEGTRPGRSVWLPELKYGAKGDFEVMVDGKKIFSMQEKGRFPEEKEVVKLLEKQKR